MRFEDLVVGRSAEMGRTVSQEDIAQYAALTGDSNPVHLDEEVALRSRFKGRIAHGMLSAGFISAVLGTQLPGPGVIYLAQTLRFTRPVRPGDRVTTRVEVAELMPDKRRVRMLTVCRNQEDQVVLDGEATVWLPEDSS